MATQQQHPSQLEKILTTPHHYPQYNQGYMPAGELHHPQYNQQPGYMSPQMGVSHLGPPPQYPTNRPQPTPVYSQMPVSRPGMIDPGMQIAGGGGGGAGGAGGGGSNFMYQQQFNSNANNNNNNMMLDPVMGFNSLPPQDKLSRFVEHL